MTANTTTTSLTCPACGSEFHSPLIISYNIASQDTDFCPNYEGGNPMPEMLHVCDECGFVGFQADYKELNDWEALENLRVAIRGFGFEGSTSLTGPERYRRAAVYALYLGKSHAEIAELYLQATWCARLSGEDEDSQQRSRRKAVEYFERAIAAEEFSSQDLPVAHYLIGELRRRLGDTEGALEHFNAVDATGEEVDPLIRELRDEQRDSIRRPGIGENES